MSPGEFRSEVVPLGRKLYSFAYRFLNVREESEDVVQEVMIRLWEKRDDLEKISSTEAFAMAMTRNICIDRLRRRKHTGGDYDINSPLISDTDLTEKIENAEAYDHIFRIISQIKEPYKTAIILRDIEGLSYEESSEITGLTVNALRVNLSRARKMVRDEMTKLYGYGSERDKRDSAKVL